MTRSISKGLLFAAALIASAACAADESIVCPRRADVGSGSVAAKSTPEGFEPFVADASLLLTGVSVFDGPPQEGATLVPTAETGKGTTIRWDLEGASPVGTWVSCDHAYGVYRLVRKLKSPVAICTASVKRSGSPSFLDANFRCR